MSNRVCQVEVIIFKRVESKPVFLVLKRQPDRGGFWQPVTGGVDEGENLKEAAIREMEEETGITDFITIHEKIHFFEFETNGGFGRLEEFVYGIQVPEEAESVISDEHTEQKWCTLEEALELLKYDSNKVGFRKIAEL